MSLGLDIILFVLFILTVALLVIKDRKKMKFEGIVIMRRTQKGRKFIDSVARNHPRFWNALAVIGVIISVPALIAGTLFLVSNAFAILHGDVKEGVRFVLPYPIGEANTQTPGLLLLPWWIWVIGIMTVVVPHELMHGIVCRLERVRIKSLGWLLLAVIPGAFVEPDENQLKKMPRKTKMKVYAAGSFANFIVAGIALLLGFLLVSALYAPVGIVPSSLVADSPAAKANLSGAILAINNIPVKSTAELSDILNRTPAGSDITIKTTKGEHNITTAMHPELEKSFIGVSGPYYIYKAPVYPGLDALQQLLFWIFVLNLGIGVINILPLKPLDGGLLFEEIAGRFSKRSALITKAVSLAILGLLLFNIFGPVFV